MSKYTGLLIEVTQLRQDLKRAREAFITERLRAYALSKAIEERGLDK